MGSTVVFYDGVCGLCNRLVRFLIQRDRHARLLFAPLQGTLARTVLPAQGSDPSDIDTVYVIADFARPPAQDGEPRVLARSRAILYALAELGPGWRVMATLARLVPRAVSDGIYNAVARRRYRTFGKYDTCPMPPAEWRGRFLE